MRTGEPQIGRGVVPLASDANWKGIVGGCAWLAGRASGWQFIGSGFARSNCATPAKLSRLVFGEPAKRLAGAAEKVQTVLGEHQDAVATEAWAAAAACRPGLIVRVSSPPGRWWLWSGSGIRRTPGVAKGLEVPCQRRPPTLRHGRERWPPVHHRAMSNPARIPLRPPSGWWSQSPCPRVARSHRGGLAPRRRSGRYCPDRPARPL